MTQTRLSILDPLQGLPLTDLRYDQVCELPDPPVQDRIGSRTFPSIVQLFDNGIVNLPALLYEDSLAYHDLWGQGLPFELRFQHSLLGIELVGDIDRAVAKREELLAKNPSMIFLAQPTTAGRSQGQISRKIGSVG